MYDWCYQFECHFNHSAAVLLFGIMYNVLPCSKLWVFDLIAEKNQKQHVHIIFMIVITKVTYTTMEWLESQLLLTAGVA
jgi:hypothetical protein